MNVPDSDSAPAGSDASSPAPRTSLLGRLVNVIAAPGDVFDEVKTAPASVWNWLLPTLLLMVVGGAGLTLIFSQPAMRQQQDEAQAKVIHRLVEKGKLPREQADTILLNAGGGPAWKYILGPAVGVAALSLASPFWGAFLIWLIGSKIHKGGFGYVKALEVAGLANTVAVLGSLLKTLLVLALGSIYASTSAAMLLKEFDPFQLSHSALAMLDVFALWICVVRALGMARLGNLSFGLCLTWLLLIWAALNGLILGVVVAFRSLLGF
jgi:hypothetical protein